jgi:hypothetical protein
VVGSSPVRFSIGAANQTPGRKVEVWVDGKKMGEQRKGAFSYYSFLDATHELSNGNHTVTVLSAGWDNMLQEFTFPLTVGGTTCAPPWAPGVNVCSPLNHGTVTGTVARMEVWVNGVKRYTTYGKNTLKTNITVGAGAHKFVYYIVNTDGHQWKQTVYATVPYTSKPPGTNEKSRDLESRFFIFSKCFYGWEVVVVDERHQDCSHHESL